MRDKRIISYLPLVLITTHIVRAHDPLDIRSYPVRLHLEYIILGKMGKNMRKSGPDRIRTCDLADNGSIPTRYQNGLFENRKLSNV
jgi:hypothetical protein